MKYLNYIFPNNVTGWLFIGVIAGWVLHPNSYGDGMATGVWLAWVVRNILNEEVK